MDLENVEHGRGKPKPISITSFSDKRITDPKNMGDPNRYKYSVNTNTGSSIILHPLMNSHG